MLRIHSYNSPGAGAGAVLFLKGRSRSRSHRKSGGSATLLDLQQNIGSTVGQIKTRPLIFSNMITCSASLAMLPMITSPSFTWTGCSGKVVFFSFYLFFFFSWITTMFEKLWIKVIRNNLDRVGEKRIFPNGQGQLGGPHTRLYFQLKKNFKKIVTCKIHNAQLSEHKRIGKR